MVAFEEFSKWMKGRATMTWGKSQETIPEFGRANPDLKCDLVLIDGEKSKNGRYAWRFARCGTGRGPSERAARYRDMVNMRELSHKNTLVLMDEITTLDCVYGRGEESGKRLCAVARLLTRACCKDVCAHQDGETTMGYRKVVQVRGADKAGESACLPTNDSASGGSVRGGRLSGAVSPRQRRLLRGSLHLQMTKKR